MVEVCLGHGDISRVVGLLLDDSCCLLIDGPEKGEIFAMPGLYFAYGSNMSAEQMAVRCPGAVAMAVAKLDDWQFIINQLGAAALRRAEGKAVWGVIWRCHARHMANLDRYEAVARGIYYREQMKLSVKPLNQAQLATVYTASDQTIGAAPIPGYVEHAILPGAEAFGLPEAYTSELQTWLPGGSAYPDPDIRRQSTFRFGLKKARKFTGWGGQR